LNEAFESRRHVLAVLEFTCYLQLNSLGSIEPAVASIHRHGVVLIDVVFFTTLILTDHGDALEFSWLSN
jgi:hypothetical protein